MSDRFAGAAVLSLFTSFAAAACVSGAARSKDSVTESEPAPPASPESPAETAESIGEEDWAWVISRYPDASEYRSAADRTELISELGRWVPAGERTVVYDRLCRPISVEPSGEGLVGRASEQRRGDAQTRRTTFESISFTDYIMVSTRSSGEEEELVDDEWVVTASRGSSGGDTAGHLLSRVTEEAVWYDALPVRLSVDCTHRLIEEMECTNGEVERCERCLEWGIHTISQDPRVGTSRRVRTTSRRLPEPTDCVESCPKTETPAEVMRAREILEDRLFVQEGYQPHPFLFRTRGDCSNYWSEHERPGDEGAPW